MSLLAERRVRAIVGSTLVDGLRVQFKVRKTVEKRPNECELSITNLTATQRAAMQAKGIALIVEAGYATTIAQIFSGQTRYVSSAHPGADWVTKIQSGDGERAYRWEIVNESFKPGTTVAQVFGRIAPATGLDVQDAIDKVRELITEQFTQGYTAFGKVSKQIDRLLKGRGLEWSIQDGKLQVTEIDKPTAGNAVLLSPSTGLIDSPSYGSPAASEKPEPGVIAPKSNKQILKVKSLLQPRIRPGALIRVESEEIKGNFRCQSVDHTGDTHGQEWYSEADVVPV